MIDLGTGNNNKINWALDDKQEMIDLIEVQNGYLTIQY
jgi:DIM1 family U5 snRNP protein